MTTSVYINDLPLDEGSCRWPIYRGTRAQVVSLYGMAERYAEYQALAVALKGGAATLRFRSGARAGGRRGLTTVSIAEVYVRRVVKVNDLLCRIDCSDARLLLERAVGAMDFNMTFGDDFLDGTEYATYREAIEAYCTRSAIAAPRMAGDAYDRIPTRKLESNVHLSGMMQGDPLGYLCERAGCDLVVGTDGLWYFAARADAEASWFTAIQDYYWKIKPGFLSLDSVVLQRPRTIVSYYWEHHCLRAEGSDPNSTVAGYGPAATRIQLGQVYLYDNEYLTLAELCEALGFVSTFVTDAQIAAAIFRPSAQGCPVYPVDTANRKRLWATIQRDWRRLYRIEFPSGNTGGWDMWRFGKLKEDGSIDPVSVECVSVVFKRVVIPGGNGTFEGAPWTENLAATSCPFKAVWDDGPESGVIRLVVDDTNSARNDDALPPMPGALQVTRNGQTDNALRIEWKGELDNGTERATVRNLDILAREDITKARMAATFSVYVYLVARRFMPNDNTRWHAQSNVGFGDGDVDLAELPPADEVNCYRTFVGGTAPAALADGLGAILNQEELDADSERRAEVYKIVTHASETGEGEAETFNLATLPRIVDGPVAEIALVADGVEGKVHISVGNLSDSKAREAIATQRIAKRKVDVQGVTK